jgi:hypothetical protein
MPEDQPLKDCDWSKIELPKPTDAQLRPNAGKLSDLDWAKLQVKGALINKSIGAILQTAVITYVQRTWPADLERLHIVANRERISIEEAFERIARGQLEP